jgi:hypothetical protein
MKGSEVMVYREEWAGAMILEMLWMSGDSAGGMDIYSNITTIPDIRR